MSNINVKIKGFVKNLIENFRRFFNQKSIFSFKYEGEEINLYLPLKRDHLQQQIIVKWNFYESSELGKIRRFIQNNSVILDIGANIGNHAIYFGKILKAKRIYCFEPQKEAFNILKRNIHLNDLEKNIVAYNEGLGNKNSKGRIKERQKNNLGGSSIEESKKGELKIKRLDSLNIKEKVSFIKIDVEGFEKEVLKGGQNFIIDNKPIVWIEVDKNNQFFVLKYFKKIGYKRIKDDNLKNWLFIPKNENS
ncbi:MAG: FkbM family methyltransferase [Candidatus Pacearchaeota archaeon]